MYLQQARHLPFQVGQIILDNVPNQQQVDTPVAMNETIPEGDDLAPPVAGAFTSRDRQARGRLTDNLEIANDSVLDKALCHECVATTSDIGLDSRDAVSDVSKIREIASHKGCASASMKGRKCGLRLRSVTRSTRRASTLSSSSTNAR